MSGTVSDPAPAAPADSGHKPPRIILVRPQLPENIGAVARAMLNCGLEDLALVAPRQAWTGAPPARAVAMASGADRLLATARHVPDIAAATAGLHRVYATTARRRDMAWRVLTPRAAARDMRAAAAGGARCGILFGPENAGLTNDDLAHADSAVIVPLNPRFSSLNLAQAVLLSGYEWFQAGLPAGAAPAEPAPAPQQDVEDFLARLERSLDAAGFFRSPDMRPVMARNLRALFRRGRATGQEIRTLHGVLSALIRR